MDTTNIDAIEFTQDNKKQFRVYYQTTDNYIRESCYHADHGWFTGDKGIVTTEARQNSPITATRWNEPNNKVTQIRVYFLDDQKNIREAKGVYQPSSGTAWSTTGLLTEKNKPNVVDGSQLSIARPDSDDATLKIFYQEPVNEDRKYPIREFKYSRSQSKWVVAGPKIEGGIEKTHLSAVSDRRSKGHIRLYFQGTDDKIWESYWNGHSWSLIRGVQDQFKLVSKAPISAVSWYIKESREDSDLRIRIYTILKTAEHTVAQVSYNGDDWDDEAPAVAQIFDQTSKAVTSARDTGTKAPATDPVSMFYQPKRKVISIKPIQTGISPEYLTAKDNIELPAGIPTSRTVY